LHALNVLAGVLREEGRFAEAMSVQIPVLDTLRRTQGEENPETLDAMSNLADAYQGLGKYDLAQPLQIHVLEVRRRDLGAQHPDTIAALTGLAFTRLQLKKFAEAEPLIRESLAAREKSSPDSWERFNEQVLLGASLAGQGRYAEAEPLLVEGYGGLMARESSIPKVSRFYLEAAGPWIVRFYQDWGKPEKAVEWTQNLRKTSLAHPSKQDQ
jgi:eukaryotic-like serine/threonine-protein kinase